MKTGKKTLEIMVSAHWYNNWLIEIIGIHLSGRILEVGAGIGNFTKKLSKFGNVTAIDNDSEYNNAKFGDIETGKYFFSNREFETVVCLNVLEHIENDEKALENIYALLSPGGKLILLSPAFNWAYCNLDKELGHFRRYTTHEINKKLISTNFKIIKTSYLNWLGLVGWIIFGKILGSKIIPENELKIFDKIAPLLLYPERYLKFPFGLSVLAVAEK